MAKRTVEESSLTAVADAIRDRTGTSEPLVFPDGFVSAVEGIPDYSTALIDRSIEEIENNLVTDIGTYAFQSCSKLAKASFPNATKVNGSAFSGCSALVDVNLPKMLSTANNAFQGCGFSKFDCPSFWYIAGSTFKLCSNLTALVLRVDRLATLVSTNCLESTPIASGTGYIYVPRSLVDSYKSATNWSTYANQIRAIEDYPDITGG